MHFVIEPLLERVAIIFELLVKLSLTFTRRAKTWRKIRQFEANDFSGLRRSSIEQLHEITRWKGNERLPRQMRILMTIYQSRTLYSHSNVTQYVRCYYYVTRIFFPQNRIFKHIHKRSRYDFENFSIPFLTIKYRISYSLYAEQKYSVLKILETLFGIFF